MKKKVFILLCSIMLFCSLNIKICDAKIIQNDLYANDQYSITNYEDYNMSNIFIKDKKIFEGNQDNSQAMCDNIFSGKFGKYLKNVMNIIKFLVPILIIGLSIVDFIKALAAQSQDEIKKSGQRFIKRLIIGIIIFLVPTILEFLLNQAGIEFGVCALG